MGIFTRVEWRGYWGADIVENWNQYEEIFKFIDDAKSKSNLLNIMMARLTTDWKYYEECLDDREKEYFDKEIINLFGKQVIVDGGGYIGDTYHCFCKIWGKEYIWKWYLYEPDLKNIQEAQVLLKYEKNVVLRPVGLAEKEGVANFLAMNSVASSCNKDGSESIKVVSLDLDIHEKITLIKLDIEGEELAALKGAKRHIAEEKPILAICLYHKKKDIPEIINYVKFLNPGYKLYIRHYSMAHWDTILYAIP